ncbi:MAG: replication factor C small subunit [Euryarchaeota archaeon]|nr:replication factor C small subunit [Euryarchaeota archaeon]
MEEIWVEKWRPKTLDEVAGQKEVVERLKSYVKVKNLPHMIFAGPAGTGKTSATLCLARELFGQNWRANFLEMNASDERGIDVVRGKIKDFARTIPLGEVPFKIIFLDEADALTPDAQNALRRTMENFTATTRFILSCNFSSKIIDPIQSRCAVYRFKPLSKKEVSERLKFIAKNEKLNIADDAIDAIIYVSEGDMRRAVNLLQAAASLGKKITAETMYQTAAIARPEEVKELIHVALKGDFLAARDKLDELLITYGMSGEDILQQIHKEIFALDVPEDVKVKIADKAGEYDFRMVEGANERIQLEALLAQITLIGEGLGIEKKKKTKTI